MVYLSLLHLEKVNSVNSVSVIDCVHQKDVAGSTNRNANSRMSRSVDILQYVISRFFWAYIITVDRLLIYLSYLTHDVEYGIV